MMQMVLALGSLIVGVLVLSLDAPLATIAFGGFAVFMAGFNAALWITKPEVKEGE